MIERSALEQALLYVGAAVAVFVVLTGELIVAEQLTGEPVVQLAEVR